MIRSHFFGAEPALAVKTSLAGVSACGRQLELYRSGGAIVQGQVEWPVFTPIEGTIR